MSEWKEYVLEDVIDKFIDYRGKTPTKTTFGIPLVTAKIVKAGKILTPNEFIASEDYDSWMTRGLPEIDDIVLTTEAPLGEVALIKDKNVALAQRIITLRGKKEYVYNPFLKFYFQNNIGQHELQSRASGTTVFGIKAAVLKKLPIELPSVKEQKAIAATLSSLDDKIDLLYRQNLTLEAMTETLFRQWFVEKTGNWKEGTLGDVLELIYGKALKNEVRTGSGYPVVGSNGIVGHHAEYLVKGPGIVIGRKGTLGKVNYLFKSFFPIDTTYYIKSKTDSAGLLYEYFLLKTLNFENSDSAVPGLNRDIALSEEIKIPPTNIVKEFNEFCAHIFSKIDINSKQIETLQKLRDSLLPKLMSGEVRVEYDETTAK
ncbi:MAG: restriction endonuclease subunit S [Methylobacter sp.]|nr:restriction endonuclease subunit S [Methylobacter sp.]